MAFMLTASGLRKQATEVMHGIGTPAASASAGTFVGYALSKRATGSGRLLMGAACVGGGAVMAVKGKGRIVPYAGVGLGLGALFGLLER